MSKSEAEIQREFEEFDKAMQRQKVKWQKKRNPMSHLKPKKKKRK